MGLGRTERTDRPLGRRFAALLVFVASAAVLMIELVALRLLAPYLGLTLQTNTLVIGLALAAIAAGAWWGGQLADRQPTRRLLVPLLLVSGVIVAFTPYVVRATAETVGRAFLVFAIAGCVLLPGALLAAVTPIVTKSQLSHLGETGTIVGRLSAISTIGAVFGTILTGFVLISRVPITGIMTGLGAVLVVLAGVVAVRFRFLRGVMVAGLTMVIGGGVAASLGPGGCTEETTYHCLVVSTDPGNATGRVLLLDGDRHSYVDVADPKHLEFSYERAFAAAVDTKFPNREPLRAYHLGAGALTFPRYLSVTRPGTRSVVSEIDSGVAGAAHDLMGVAKPVGVLVRVEDGRLGLGRLPDHSQDLIVGDAFSGLTVPWHLTTREAVHQVARVLDDNGMYMANLVDTGPLDLARAEVATLQESFPYVALAAVPETFTIYPNGGGNMVVLASNQPLPVTEWQTALSTRGPAWEVVTGEALAEWVGDAPVLTDDFAPVDQLLRVRHG